LLLKLSNCVAEKHCQHYFISNCNLLDSFAEDDSSIICNNLRNFANESVLLSWFFENYVCECAQVARVHEQVEHHCSIDEVERIVNVIIDWKSNMLPRDLYEEYVDLEMNMLFLNLIYRRDAMTTLMIMKALQNCDHVVRDYSSALMSLRVAFTMEIQSTIADLLEVLWTIFFACNLDSFDGAVSRPESAKQLPIRKAMKLATLSSVRRNALDVLYDEMAKAYLHQSLTCKQDSTYRQETTCLMEVLLAALYYKSGHYRAAIAYCKQVEQLACDHRCLCYIGEEHLCHIDKTVDSLFGLILFYQHVHQKALNPNLQRLQDSKPVLTSILLAQYLYSKCITVADEKRNRVIKYRHVLSCTNQVTLTDVLLFKTIETHLGEFIEITVSAVGTDDTDINILASDNRLLVTSLEQVALEKLITYRQLMVRQVHCQQFPVVNEFELFHMYRRGLFQSCFGICRNHIYAMLNNRPMLSNYRMKTQKLLLLSPIILSLLDGELLSLFGVVQLLHRSWLSLYIKSPLSLRIAILTVLLYLMTQCQKKLRSDSVYDSLALIRYVHDTVFDDESIDSCFDPMILKLIYRSSKMITPPRDT